jgi:tRNA threonylcarbamoyladenosine biosynthesis protein TsaE
MILTDRQIINHYVNNGFLDIQGKTYGLIGSLGVGKTYLVKCLLSSVSIEFGKQVHSPTFNLCNIYQWDVFEVHHFDLYRIDSNDDLFNIGIMDSISSKTLITFIEWVDLFPELLDCCDEIITITEDNESERHYAIDPINEVD